MPTGSGVPEPVPEPLTAFYGAVGRGDRNSMPLTGELGACWRADICKRPPRSDAPLIYGKTYRWRRRSIGGVEGGQPGASDRRGVGGGLGVHRATCVVRVGYDYGATQFLTYR